MKCETSFNRAQNLPAELLFYNEHYNDMLACTGYLPLRT